MRWLVTAGGTVVPIDRVRCIANSFTGRTGARIAVEAFRRGNRVILLTSQPHAVAEIMGEFSPSGDRWQVVEYRTFDELHQQMERVLHDVEVDVVVHSAAVSDYRSVGVFAPAPGTRFDPVSGAWIGAQMVDRLAEKVKSDEQELWLRLVKTPKLIDRVRTDWGFRGVLVKFKLEVAVTDAELLATAERSRVHSRADLVVANTLEETTVSAWIGAGDQFQRVSRAELPAALIHAVERLRLRDSDG